MSTWKNRAVIIVMALLSISSPVFIFAGYVALWQAWVCGDLPSALPFLPWSRVFGILAVACAAAAFVILFSPETFPVKPKTRFTLSLLATITIGLFAEFRNEGKFHFGNAHHFFAPGTWMHGGLNHLVPSLGDFLYRMEFSHWNDFLMGPAIVSVLYPLVFCKIHGAFQNRNTIGLITQTPVESTGSGNALRFARILMYTGLFWFFIRAWAEKAGYLSNPHSKDEIDLPFEFAGTMAGFWMARVLTGPFSRQPGKFRSTFLADFVSSGVIGLLYTLITGLFTESVAGTVARVLYPGVPGCSGIHESTVIQQRVRPLELLLLAAASWWILNRVSRHEEMTRLGNVCREPEAGTKWSVPVTVIKAAGVMAGYLLLLAAMLSLCEPPGSGWTLPALAAGTGAGITGFWLAWRAGRQGVTVLFSGKRDAPVSPPRANGESKSPPG